MVAGLVGNVAAGGVAAIGVAQEFQRMFTGTTDHSVEGGEGVPRFG
jgi:hypothetical protein